MNMWGNIGGAISPLVLAYLVRAYGWEAPFLVAAALLCRRGTVVFENRRLAAKYFAE